MKNNEKGGIKYIFII